MGGSCENFSHAGFSDWNSDDKKRYFIVVFVLVFSLGPLAMPPSVPYLKYAYFIIIQALNVRICLTRLVLF